MRGLFPGKGGHDGKERRDFQHIFLYYSTIAQILTLQKLLESAQKQENISQKVCRKEKSVQNMGGQRIIRNRTIGHPSASDLLSACRQQVIGWQRKAFSDGFINIFIYFRRISPITLTYIHISDSIIPLPCAFKKKTVVSPMKESLSFCRKKLQKKDKVSHRLTGVNCHAKLRSRPKIWCVLWCVGVTSF